MRGVPTDSGERPSGRVRNWWCQRRRIAGEWGEIDRSLLKKAGSGKTQCPQLLAGVKKHAPAAPHDCLPSLLVAHHVSCAQSRSKVIPGGLPERRALRSQLPGIRAASSKQNRGRLCTLRRPCRGVHFPSEPQRKGQPRRYSPFVLGEEGEILDERVPRGIRAGQDKPAIV